MEKIKQFLESEKGRNIVLILIVILVGLASFELGRLSKGSRNGSSGLKIEYSGIEPSKGEESMVSTIKPTEKAFFASKIGSKYYPAGCAAGQSIKPENKVYFSTSSNAEKAGYELSSSCR
jgi:hypothetical protein